MLISEIKNKEVRERAEFYVRERDEFYARKMPGYCQELSDKNDLFKAFLWSDTDEGSDFWARVNSGEEIDLPPAVPAKFDMPRLPAGWRYTRKYRQPEEGEYYFFCGEVKHCKGRTAGWYPIVRYVGVES